jgi:hypothetical protein
VVEPVLADSACAAIAACSLAAPAPTQHGEREAASQSAWSLIVDQRAMWRCDVRAFVSEDAAFDSFARGGQARVDADVPPGSATH